MKLLGLIGYPLSHSFSKKYFTQKFEREGLTQDWQYELFPIETIEKFPELIQTYSSSNSDSQPYLVGLNVTIPYKEAVMPFLDDLHETAKDVGAVNCIKFSEGKLIGYNTDYFGFQKSLLGLLEGDHLKGDLKALILGTGGSAKAVAYALKDLNIPYQYVSRKLSENGLTYDELNTSILKTHRLIINTTPLGMSPHTEGCPSIPYESLNETFFLYDLVYNPELTTFLKNGKSQGAKVKNGLDMLHFQAEKGWAIWTEND
jgi:shikimate dehydrogenase